MRNQSKNVNLNFLEKVYLDSDFPISIPDFNTRTENPIEKPHVHNYFEIGYCFDGAGIFIINNKTFTFQAGDAVVINTDEIHIAKSNVGGSTSWGFLYLDPIHLLCKQFTDIYINLNIEHYSGADFKNIIDGTRYPELTYCIKQILLEAQNKQAGYRSSIRSFVWQMLVQLYRYYPPSEKKHKIGNYADVERIAPALDYINNHFNCNIKVPHLASLCYTSESNFRKLFNLAMGTAPLPFVMQIRLKVACAMLKNSSKSILYIATYCGYKTLSNFNRQFLKEFQISPRQYRNL